MTTGRNRRTPLGAYRADLRTWAGRDTTGGTLLLLAALIALIWANTPARDSYQDLLAVEVGPSALGLHLSLAQWAADGLLAVFFFVVGVELKHEFVVGALRDRRLAGVPIVAAVAGMAVPALIYVVVVGIGEPSALSGWAIPTATDIAFALAVLAVVGRGLPMAVRTFLMTLAVVDDLLGITVIATFYTDSIDFGMLAAALAVIGVFGVVVRMPRPVLPLLIPLAVVAWAFMHASGVHATVAGVLLGFTVPARAIRDEQISRTHQFGEALNPWSSAVALPLFAFAAAGVTVVGDTGALISPVSVAIVVALVVGKTVGVVGATALTTRYTALRLPDRVTLRDLLPIGMLTGIGFTVALLIAELSFDGPDDPRTTPAKAAILVGSLLSATLGALLLRWDTRRHRASD
ncbi:Na+/H+ antiporter NhaA [Gordonia sp. ABSL1-1]|uniref:Na+/H+ antiporter NhaA n=1 Tax=Gordonia sp. ABSL1-1 TaxID=3053923 RepID=UPI0025730C27|nr:Na+/H+ antiporter NhaA [Gordonia sp. ABSL1-1]MDL9938959.1 Na+/H+ antiporter NhaA [Gordonia sp. ABSL1-1]